MATYVVLLRGINLGRRNRIAMPELRGALEDAGFEKVRSHLQSGNVVLGSGAKAETVRRKVEQVIADRFGLEIPVVVRTRAELAAVVKRNPLGKVATEPKRYQVSFLEEKLPAKTLKELEAVAAPERAGGRARPRGLCVAPGRRRALEAVGEAGREGPRRHRDRAELDDGRGAARTGRGLRP